ncbi:MAG TPA: class I SAM-dependent methyltransferase [Candidatus Eisenbacteria bacterium]|nr:class I SAM-dependent methyltransferase [Candidatus Eisenbacteria bacterium]
MSLSDRWDAGDSYERYIGRWSRRVALDFVTWLQCPPGLSWLDVGCGTGALSAAVLERAQPSAMFAVEPSDGFRRTAKANLGERATVLAGDAASLPLENAAVDAVVSGLVLNFVPDRAAALQEMKRVTRPGGTIAGYVWDYAGKMEFLRAFWDVAGEVDPVARDLDEATRFPLCGAEPLRAMFESGALADVDVRPIDIPTPFASFDELWQPFLGGQGPAPTYVASLSPQDRERLRERLRLALPVAPDGSISLMARAWAARGKLAMRAGI